MENVTWDTLASDESVAKAKTALEANGFSVIITESSAAAKAKAFELLPEGAEVMTMTSITLETLGLASEINDSGKYNSVRKTLSELNKETDGDQMNKLGAGPQWTIGSVHAVTEDGHVIIASNTGSQLPAYAYGAQHVIWVVGSQKIVTDVEAGLKRINEYVLDLESERARKAYGVAGSSVNKLLIVNKEVAPGRITIIIVKEKLGF